MCWYALLSTPGSYCEPDIELATPASNNSAMVFMLILTSTIVTYCVLNGSIILNVFNPEGEGILSSYYAKASQEQPGVQLSRLSTPTSNLIERDTDRSSTALDELPPSGSKHERVFFHILMLLTSCYLGMLLTNWGEMKYQLLVDSSDTSDNNSHDGGLSMWFKIAPQWMTIILQFRVLYIAHIESDEPLC